MEGEGHYTTIVATGGRYLSNLSLAVLESRLDLTRFLRVHRSHIVNLDYVTEIVRQDDCWQVDQLRYKVLPIVTIHFIPPDRGHIAKGPHGLGGLLQR